MIVGAKYNKEPFQSELVSSVTRPFVGFALKKILATNGAWTFERTLKVLGTSYLPNEFI